jgi:hypothetical protein
LQPLMWLGAVWHEWQPWEQRLVVQLQLWLHTESGSGVLQCTALFHS